MPKYSVEITVYVRADNHRDAAREVNDALSYVMVGQGFNLTGATVVDAWDMNDVSVPSINVISNKGE